MTVGERIKARRKTLGLSAEDIAERIGKSAATIYRYEKGDIKSVDSTIIVPLSEALSTTPAYLMGWSDDPLDYDSMDSSDIDPEVVRELGNDPEKLYAYRKALAADQERTSFEMSLPSNVRPISALHHQRVPMIGRVAAGEPIYDPEDAGVYVDSPVKADAAITIQGDSMEPTYLEGDVVYIKCVPDVPEGAVAVVFLDDEATIKHVYKRPTGLTLWSDNPAHMPFQIEYEDYARVRVFGVPVGFTRIFRSRTGGRIQRKEIPHAKANS
ncbi:MAG: helix-turn-helix domain-containing protein [Oscillospiraceae bacterium]|nr:helix-turn-helix domain-containing protein [Oscillospiraceae bacterium]